jgi:hypothetical protein
MAFSLRLKAAGGRGTVEAKKFAPPDGEQLPGDIPRLVSRPSYPALRSIRESQRLGEVAGPSIYLVVLSSEPGRRP